MYVMKNLSGTLTLVLNKDTPERYGAIPIMF